MSIWATPQGRKATIGGMQYAVEKSPLVPVLNQALVKAGFGKGEVGTEYAKIAGNVAAFQKSVGLTVDGDAGPNTCAALRPYFGQLTPATAQAAVEAMIRAYNYGVVCYVTTGDENLGDAVRTWGRWLSSARRAGLQKSPKLQKADLASNKGPTRVVPVGQGTGTTTGGGIVQLGFAPALALGFIAEGAAPVVAAAVVEGAGYVASAAAAAWAAVAIGKAASATQAKTADKETSVSTTSPVEDIAPLDPQGPKPGQTKWDLKGNPKGWLAILGALCASVAAVVINGLGVVAAIAPVAGAAIALGLELVVAVGGIVLLWVMSKRKRGK